MSQHHQTEPSDEDRLNTKPMDNNRWTKEGATPGEDPNEIDSEQQDPETVRRLQETRPVIHDDQETETDLSISSSTYDPTSRDSREEG